MITKDDILLTHQNCPDGSGSAVLFIAAGGTRENVYFAGAMNSDVDKTLRKIIKNNPGAKIYCVDVSPTEEMAQELLKEMVNIVLIDHHATAIPLAKYNFAIIDKENSRCGSKMFYDYLIQEHDWIKPYDDFATLLDDRDRWVNRFPESGELYTLHGIVGQEEFIRRFSVNPVVTFGIGEKYILDVEEKKLKRILERKKSEVLVKTVNIKGKNYKFGYVVSEMYQSEIGNYLTSIQEPNIDVCVIIGAKKCSMRTNEKSGIDLSELAKLNEGGGHKFAAGFDTKNILDDSIEQLVYQGMRYE